MLRYLLLLASQLTSTPESPPDGWFYYALTLFLGTVISVTVGWIVKSFLDGQKIRNGKVDEAILSIRNTLNELVSITKVHEEKHRQHDQEIEDLKKYTVKYRK